MTLDVARARLIDAYKAIEMWWWLVLRPDDMRNEDALRRELDALGLR